MLKLLKQISNAGKLSEIKDLGLITAAILVGEDGDISCSRSASDREVGWFEPC